MPKLHVTDRNGGEHELEVQNGASLMEPLRDEIDGGFLYFKLKRFF